MDHFDEEPRDISVQPEKKIDRAQTFTDWKLSSETKPFAWESRREKKVNRTDGGSWTLIEPSWCADATGGAYFTTMPVTRQLERDLAKEKVIAHVNAKMNQGLIPPGVKCVQITYSHNSKIAKEKSQRVSFK